jgi:hypothetical protein
MTLSDTSSPELDSMGAFGKSVYDVACLLDVLIPEQSFQASLSEGQSSLAIGVSSERVSAITDEEEALYSEDPSLLPKIFEFRYIKKPRMMVVGRCW